MPDTPTTNNVTNTANDDVESAVREAIDGGEIGIQVAAYLEGDLVADISAGVADAASARAVTGETVFPVFSVSKAVTATALHLQAERGLVDYSAPIVEYWPEFGQHRKEVGTVYDALTHRLGVPLMPSGVTPELMCDWEWMVRRIADMHPLFEPGTQTAYMSYTFGWIVGEIVRRTDPSQRPFAQFVQQEICEPLGIDSLWFGIPDEIEPRVARLQNIPPSPPGDPGLPPGVVSRLAIPQAVGACQEVFGRADVRRASIPGAGGIMNARSMARIFALLAGEGEFGGARLLSPETVRRAMVPGPPARYDMTIGRPQNVTVGGFHLVGRPLMAPAGHSPTAFGHPGAGGAIGWADPSVGLAVGITHNRMFAPSTEDDNPLNCIGRAVRRSLGLPEHQARHS